MDKKNIFSPVLGITIIIIGAIFTQGLILYTTIGIGLILLVTSIIIPKKSSKPLKKITQEDIQKAVKQYEPEEKTK